MIDSQRERRWAPIGNRSIKLSKQMLLNIVQEQWGERTSWYMGSLQPEAEGSPAPEAIEATSFERSVTRRSTVSSRSVHISVKGRFWSRKACEQ